jgi:hypothetical protein
VSVKLGARFVDTLHKRDIAEHDSGAVAAPRLVCRLLIDGSIAQVSDGKVGIGIGFVRGVRFVSGHVVLAEKMLMAPSCGRRGRGHNGVRHSAPAETHESALEPSALVLSAVCYRG